MINWNKCYFINALCTWWSQLKNMYIYIFTWKQNWKHLYQMWTALCLSYAILWNVIRVLARVLPCGRLHGGSLSFSVKAPPSSSILNLSPGLTYSCFLLLWILQRYYIIWRSKASMWGLNNMFCFGFFYNISYSRNHMFWCLIAMYPSYEPWTQGSIDSVLRKWKHA